MKNKASRRRSATGDKVESHRPGDPSLLNGVFGRSDTKYSFDREKSCHPERARGRGGDKGLCELQAQEEASPLGALGDAMLDLKQKLSLARLPRNSNLAERLSGIVHSSSKEHKEKAGMAAIAVDALAAYKSAQEGVVAENWSDALKAAVSFGRCIGRLDERLASSAPRRGKGIIKGQLLESFRKWKADRSPKKRPKFDTQAVMEDAPKLKDYGTRSLANMISELKAEERKYAAWLKGRCGGPKHLVLASRESFDGRYFSGEGFP